FNSSVRPIDNIGISSDIIEAQAFAFLAVRRMKNLPTSLPGLTGAKLPAVGGVFCPVVAKTLA
ncbi:MAG: anhydro-N-acetylmuramic acid kinase, partial [Rickettsiales bacterium]|nr:anhydro-N-acetylmuramic acid kinase [Rickettsiales bacterium]